MFPLPILYLILGLLLVGVLLGWYYAYGNSSAKSARDQLADLHREIKDDLNKLLAEQYRALNEHQLYGSKIINEMLQGKMGEVSSQLTSALNNHATGINQQLDRLTGHTHQNLQTITDQVGLRLTEVATQLALIDKTQKEITELSGNILGLQEILSDKRARGTFGEIQLAALLRDILPEKHFSLQHTLANGRRADCMLRLPEPHGNLVIDAKFPLENYQKSTNPQIAASEQQLAQRQFRTDIKKHIQDIAEKYILPPETADSAVMFIPAEAIFAEIHNHYPELVEASHRHRVWLVSPSTLVAILTTVRAVLKDTATHKQVHLIQQHLFKLHQDFDKFRHSMNGLVKHTVQAYQDAEELNQYAKRISSRFEQIEQVKLEPNDSSSDSSLPRHRE